ncbi:hypothetical protein BCR39DRAFT_198118 [Naematelia encephala]|uniref:HIT domain-containing protein n=1 Tax=Naematelia encephala TaxID=71784 RepID=A0A1Y2B173_9TREE|nr:hypothetical protein BCR39DRAFT_198118 [Naematelia encephala]
MKFLSCLSSPNPIPIQTHTQSSPLLADVGKPVKPGCIFCSVSSQNGFNIVYEDQELIAFHDRSPQAEQHLLIIPRYHLGEYPNVPSMQLSYAFPVSRYRVVVIWG